VGRDSPAVSLNYQSASQCVIAMDLELSDRPDRRPIDCESRSIF
jgi:hypothetical protein